MVYWYSGKDETMTIGIARYIRTGYKKERFDHIQEFGAEHPVKGATLVRVERFIFRKKRRTAAVIRHQHGRTNDIHYRGRCQIEDAVVEIFCDCQVFSTPN